MSEPDAFTSHEDDNAADEAGDELQFDQAEYATPVPAGPSCGFCKRPIDDAYYELSGKVICATCRQRVEAAFRGGSPVARVIKALVFGSAAGVAGAMLYYAIVRVTGLNIGLVAVVVGFMVGAAVRKGTGNRGGLFYQLLAVFLTYLAIVAMYVPILIEGLIKQLSLGRILELMVDRIDLLFTHPVREAIHHPISGLIYGFALWEAWKINKGLQLAINGPFRVDPSGSNAPAPEDFDDGG
ncbi:MAG: hypothetical protein ACHRXM_00830 [Isosphaerales bacterium]